MAQDMKQMPLAKESCNVPKVEKIQLLAFPKAYSSCCPLRRSSQAQTATSNRSDHRLGLLAVAAS